MLDVSSLSHSLSTLLLLFVDIVVDGNVGMNKCMYVYIYEAFLMSKTRQFIKFMWMGYEEGFDV